MRSSVLALSHPALLSNVVMSGIYRGVARAIYAKLRPGPLASCPQGLPGAKVPREDNITQYKKSAPSVLKTQNKPKPVASTREFVARRNHEYHHAHGSAEHSIFKVATRMKRPRQHVLGRWGCIININTEIYISLVGRVCIKTTISCV